MGSFLPVGLSGRDAKIYQPAPWQGGPVHPDGAWWVGDGGGGGGGRFV